MKFAVAPEKFSQTWCPDRKALQNTSLLHPKPWKCISEISCTYMDGVELEWLGEGDVEMHCTPQTLVSMTPIISLGSSMKPWEGGVSSVWVGTYVGWCVL